MPLAVEYGTLVLDVMPLLPVIMVTAFVPYYIRCTTEFECEFSLTLCPTDHSRSVLLGRVG